MSGVKRLNSQLFRAVVRDTDAALATTSVVTERVRRADVAVMQVCQLAELGGYTVAFAVGGARLPLGAVGVALDLRDEDLRVYQDLAMLGAPLWKLPNLKKLAEIVRVPLEDLCAKPQVLVTQLTTTGWETVPWRRSARLQGGRRPRADNM